MDPRESSPLSNSEYLADVLREQGATAAEIAEWTPAVQLLSDWPRRQIGPADVHRLMAALAPLAPAPSAVRQALRARSAAHRASFGWLLDLLESARTQVSVLRASFWLVSAAITLLGAYIELSPVAGNSAFFLQVLGPLLAFLGISSAFRGAGLRTLEYELACPPSPLQLVVARLVVVLGYDVALGLCLAAGLWLYGGASFLAVTLHWLMPLLLVAGLALTLSLRVSSGLAAGLAYAGWLTALVLAATAAQAGNRISYSVPLTLEIALGAAGSLLLIVAVARFPAALPRLLPNGG
jgi:hypothetical protein